METDAQAGTGALPANILIFGRLLRRAGVEVPHSRLLDSLDALNAIGLARRDDVQATLRAMLVHRHDDLALFDRAFDLFFRDRTRPPSRVPLFAPGDRPRAAVQPPDGGAIGVGLEPVTKGASDGTESNVSAYSRSAVSRSKDFADFTSAELEEARRLMTRLPWAFALRRTRRWERARATAVDLRPTLRRALTRGELLELTYRRRRTAARPIVVIADVSGSMERYSRILIHFAYGLAHSARHVESFVFATALTRISRRLAEPHAHGELTRIIRDVKDWGGGTRIGESLHTFNTEWARRVMRHGPVVLLVSDGWDRGEPETLAREVARLRRNSRRLIWLNPLLGRADYAPLTRGMQAALPHVDDFLPAHNLASLAQLARHLATISSHRAT